MKRRNILITIVIVIVLLIGICIGWFIYKDKTKKEEKPNEIIKLDTIEGYGYNLEDRDTELFKSTFEEMRKILSEKEIDYNSYAKELAKLYIIDLYTISNKVNQYDVGGSEFVYQNKKDNFELKVKDTIYKYVEDNTYGKRMQFLPEVASAEVTEIVEEKVSVLDQEYDGYRLTISWSYVKDLGYDKTCVLKIAKVDDKLYIVNQSTSSE